jgi:hypothetical protein
VLTVLHDEAITRPSEEFATDRLVDRDAVCRALDRVDLNDDVSLLRAFLLVQAWGAGTSGSRTLRHTATAFTHRDLSAGSLRSSAERLRAAQGTLALAEAYASWSCPGVGPSFFTKWFTFAGRSEGRRWQPLILDDRVYRALNWTLEVRLVDLASSKSRAVRYQVYVEAVHAWSRELDVAPDRLEWILFLDNGTGSTAAE